MSDGKVSVNPLPEEERNAQRVAEMVVRRGGAMTKPDPRIEHYVRELEGPARWVSTSHYTLADLYSRYGRETVDRLLSEHWAAVRAERGTK